MRRWKRLPILLALAACGEPSNRIVVVAYDEESLTYELEPRRFETLRDVRALEGSVTVVRAGAELVIDERVLTAPTIEVAIDRAVREDGNAVKFSAVEGDHGWVPADYHSLAMASVYWNLESASRFFQDLGVAFEELGRIPTFYLLTYRIELPGFEAVTVTDNAAYSPIPGFDGFLIFEQKILDDLPLAMNLGVMVHEYGHAVMARFRYGTPPAPDLSVGDPCTVSMLDEGTSDYFGAVATGDANFIAWSGPSRLFDRDLAEVRVLSEDQAADSLPAPCDDQTDPHLTGAVWASLLWAIGEEIGHDELAPVLLEALREFARIESPTLATLPDLLVARLAGANRPTACALIGQRFSPVSGAVSSCAGP